MFPLGNPLERAVDLANALVRTGAQAAELATQIPSGMATLRANPERELLRMQMLAARIDGLIDEALERHKAQRSAS